MLVLVCSICHSEAQRISSFELPGPKNIYYISKLTEGLNDALKLKIFLSIFPLLQLNSAVLANSRDIDTERAICTREYKEATEPDRSDIQTDLQIQERFFFSEIKRVFEPQRFFFLFFLFEFVGICLGCFIHSSFSPLVPFLSMTTFLAEF